MRFLINMAIITVLWLWKKWHWPISSTYRLTRVVCVPVNTAKVEAAFSHWSKFEDHLSKLGISAYAGFSELA